MAQLGVVLDDGGRGVIHVTSTYLQLLEKEGVVGEAVGCTVCRPLQIHHEQLIPTVICY